MKTIGNVKIAEVTSQSSFEYGRFHGVFMADFKKMALSLEGINLCKNLPKIELSSF
jgi:hypothetical protein